MAEYHGYSMSNNAVQAYNSGKRPWSRWTKTLILEDVKALTINAQEEYEENKEELDSLKKKFKVLSKCSADTLRKHLLRYSEWHHTSSRYNNSYQFQCKLMKLVFWVRGTINSSMKDINRGVYVRV